MAALRLSRRAMCPFTARRALSWTLTSQLRLARQTFISCWRRCNYKRSRTKAPHMDALWFFSRQCSAYIGGWFGGPSPTWRCLYEVVTLICQHCGAEMRHWSCSSDSAYTAASWRAGAMPAAESVAAWEGWLAGARANTPDITSTLRYCVVWQRRVRFAVARISAADSKVVDFETLIRQILWKSAGIPIKEREMDGQVCGIRGSSGLCSLAMARNTAVAESKFLALLFRQAWFDGSPRSSGHWTDLWHRCKRSSTQAIDGSN